MPEKLYLIDCMSHVYRAYYAIRGLTNRQGKPTNAVYGFTNMLRKLISEENPHYLGVVIDPAGPTVRHEQFEEYKATRRPMPDDLKEQMPDIHRVLKVLRVPVLSLEKYEADDVIGTLAQKAVSRGLDVVIVTIDKDMFQLVTDKITILDTRTMLRLDPAGVGEKFGVPPAKVIDVLSLVGDSSDNIPGAPGIGEKGAIKLIAKYGGLEELLEHRDEISHKTYRKSLQQNEEQILQSRALVRIHLDLPVDLDLEDLRLSEPDRSAVRELFTELEFVSLIEDFLPSTEELTTEYARIDTAQQLKALEKQVKGETLALAFAQSHGPAGSFAISAKPQTAVWISGDLITKASAQLQALLDSAALLVVHDLKPLLASSNGIPARLPAGTRDTMLMAYLLRPNQTDFSLSKLALDYLQYRLVERKQSGDLFEAAHDTLCQKADLTGQLHRAMEPEIDRAGLVRLLDEIELPLVGVLAAMEQVGVKVDTALLERMSLEMEGEIEELTRRIFAIADGEFNINSPKQLAEVLFERLNLPVVKRTRKAGHYATGVEVLENLAQSYEIAQLILEYRELTKLKNTYLDALPKLVDPETGRIHTSYNQMVAATGRLSSSNPNLQNIPIKSELGRKIRRAFVAEQGYKMVAADYSQIELRVMAHLSGDRVLVEAFQKGEDIHERTAREVFGMNAVMDPREFRRHAKVINFGIMYGLSAFGLAQSLKIDRREAQKFIDDYFERYQGVKEWIETTLEEARKTGFVTTLFGRIRQIPELRSRNWNQRNFGERTAINAPIQGTAADLIKMAMVAIHGEFQRRKLRSRLILQVHDELVFEARLAELDEVKKLVVDRMEGVAKLSVPLKVDLAVGDSWYEAK